MTFNLRSFLLHRNSESVLLNNLGICSSDLHQFRAFPYLTSIWLQSNRIRSLTGLDKCFRLQKLLLSNNFISTLNNSSVTKLKHLRHLCLANNQLSGLDSVISSLKHLDNLHNLNLTGNPVTEEPFYREEMIKTFPKLEILDLQLITVEERNLVTRKSNPKIAFNKTVPESTLRWRTCSLKVTKKDLFKDSYCVELMKKSMKNFSREEPIESSAAKTEPLDSRPFTAPLPTGLDYLGKERREKERVKKENGKHGGVKKRCNYVFERPFALKTKNDNVCNVSKIKVLL
ncbi:hypothetical protein P9112_004757 [Eukaryota sp. TZLM1-RC]